MKTRILFAVLLCGMISFTSCKNNNTGNEEKTEAQRQSELEAEQQQKAQEEMESNSVEAKIASQDSLTELKGLTETAEMDDLLKVDKGPFTVFAPNDEAFDELDKATLDTLMLPDNREKLTNLLQYHIVSEKLSAEELKKEIKDNDGKYVLTTMDDLGEITATLENGNVVLTDEMGNKATVVKADIKASNGIIHIIDGVLQSKEEDDPAI